MPLQTTPNLSLAQTAIQKILTHRLIQRQHGVLRRTVNARILIEFIRQLKVLETEYLRRKRIKESPFRRRISADSERLFDKEVEEVRAKTEVFAEELAKAVFMVYRDLEGRWEFDESADAFASGGGEGKDASLRSSARSFDSSLLPSEGSGSASGNASGSASGSISGSTSGSTSGSGDSDTCQLFETAFQASVEAAMREEEPKKEAESAERRLGRVSMALWSTAHV